MTITSTSQWGNRGTKRVNISNSFEAHRESGERVGLKAGGLVSEAVLLTDDMKLTLREHHWSRLLRPRSTPCQLPNGHWREVQGPWRCDLGSVPEWIIIRLRERSLRGFRSLCWRRQWHPTPVLLPGKSHGRRSLEGCSPWGREEADTTVQLHFHFSCIGEGNGNPCQYSCLENPRDGGAWWAAVYGVAQSRTRLTWLSSSSSSRNPCDQNE